MSPFSSLVPLSLSPLQGLWEKHVEPYQQDNSRLTQENVALHQQILALKESLEQRTKELKVYMRRLEHENADLKFLNNQYMQRIITQEKESQLKSERILELQEKNSQAAIIQTPGGRKKTLPYRRQRMEMDSVLNPSSSSKGKLLPVLPEPDPQVIDLLKMTEEKMIEMQRSLDSIGKEKKEMKDSIKDLKRQVRITIHVQCTMYVHVQCTVCTCTCIVKNELHVCTLYVLIMKFNVVFCIYMYFFFF